MSNQNRHKSLELKVGLFIGIGLFLFIFSLLSLREGAFLFNPKYTLKVKMSSSEGLGPGSIVQLLGISIGNIKSVDTLPSENKVVLNLNLDKSYQDMITQGSTVTSKHQGALGDKIVSIKPNVESTTPLQENGFLVFEEQANILTALLSSGDKTEYLFEILEDLSIIIKNFNQNNKTVEIMENLNESSKELKNLVMSMNVLAKDIQSQKTLTRSLAHLSSVLEKIDKGQGSLGALINDLTIYNRLDEMLSGSQRNDYVKGLVRKSIQTGRDEAN